MGKTLAAFKREAKNENLYLELLERYGETDIPNAMKGPRKIIKVRSDSIIILNNNEKESVLGFDSAKLVEYDGETLSIYEWGEREPTPEEQKCLEEWKEIEKNYIKEHPYCTNTYSEKVAFFKNSQYPYMSGHQVNCGKIYRPYNGMIRDNQIRGRRILFYKVHKEE